MHPPLPSSSQPPPSSLEPAQQHLNQNIARNLAISTNLDRKIKSCPFWLKIGTHGILEVLIPNPDLDFLKFRPQNPFLGKFGSKKSKLFLFSWKLARMASWRCWFLVHRVSQGCWYRIQTEIFEILIPKSIFG